MSATLALARALIAERSQTPLDGNCQALISERLARLGFHCQQLNFGSVSNLWAHRPGGGATAPLFVFAGHTDVVPSGPLDAWISDPFVPTERDGKLYGRGASDMKSSIAAFVVAAEEFIQERPRHHGALALLITSDEEGPAVEGTVRVCEWLHAAGIRPDYCVVGEPTSVEHVGDMIKNGRRGTLSGRLRIKGTQGHIAYPQLARNPIHLAAPALAELVTIAWDEGNDYYLPTSWQISNVHAGTGALNVIPGEMTVDFNFRFSTASTPDGLKARMHALLDRYSFEYAIDWTLGGLPFLTPAGTLSAALERAILDETGLVTELSTTGGTSDGRFLARICAEVIECGPPNASIHKVNEFIELSALEPLKNIYRGTLRLLLGSL